MRTFSLALVFALSVQLSADDKDKDKELKRFAGDWLMVAVTSDGMTIKDADKLERQVWRFEGTKLTPLENKDDVATITLDPAAKPATIDNKDKSGETVLGIYKFTGDDKLTICGADAKTRPKEFAAAKGSKSILFEFERVKKK